MEAQLYLNQEIDWEWGGWGGVEEGGEEWGKESLASHRPQHLWIFLPLSNRASISLTLTCISHFSMDDSSHFHISTLPLSSNPHSARTFHLSSLILSSSPTTPLPWFSFLSHSTARAHELKTSKACPNYTPDVTADSCTEIRH